MLKEKLLSLGGTGIFGDQIDFDPDVDLILREGQVFSGQKRFVRMVDNGCHWNVARLFEAGAVENIAIGYALSSVGKWFQHTWGISQGYLIETSEVNFLHVDKYFGVILDNPKDFVELCNNNPKGSGKVRRKFLKEE